MGTNNFTVYNLIYTFMFQEIYDSFKDVSHIKYRYNIHNSQAKLFKKMLQSLSKGISNNNQSTSRRHQSITNHMLVIYTLKIAVYTINAMTSSKLLSHS